MRAPKVSRSEAWLAQADILTEALPFMQRYAGATVLVKYGGQALADKASTQSVAADIALLHQAGVRPVLVHGGGPQIAARLKRAGRASQFHDGLRVSDASTVKIAEQALTAVNTNLVAMLKRMGARAVGVSGKDVMVARRKKSVARALGLVGEPYRVRARGLQSLLAGGAIPVISPIAADAKGETYNINADVAAGHIAVALKAARLLLLTDVAGVLNKNKRLLTELTLRDARALVRNKTAQGGMIPKLETACHAVEGGVAAAVIVDGRVRHAILLELFTGHGAGTLLRARKKKASPRTRKIKV